jgi:hypothetical protein
MLKVIYHNYFCDTYINMVPDTPLQGIIVVRFFILNH